MMVDHCTWHEHNPLIHFIYITTNIQMYDIMDINGTFWQGAKIYFTCIKLHVVVIPGSFDEDQPVIYMRTSCSNDIKIGALIKKIIYYTFNLGVVNLFSAFDVHLKCVAACICYSICALPTLTICNNVAIYA